MCCWTWYMYRILPAMCNTGKMPQKDFWWVATNSAKNYVNFLTSNICRSPSYIYLSIFGLPQQPQPWRSQNSDGCFQRCLRCWTTSWGVWKFTPREHTRNHQRYLKSSLQTKVLTWFGLLRLTYYTSRALLRWPNHASWANLRSSNYI